ncbi:hypothetical protein [Streptomyces sp. NPDC091278]|uniref:hypothetical protein n=1 Tax=Streptomyces sp. NPDC091278 TaxID=3155301 RepID=UPI00344C5480
MRGAYEHHRLERNAVERAVNRGKAWRGIATRYDKTPGSYPAGSHLPRLDDPGRTSWGRLLDHN